MSSEALRREDVLFPLPIPENYLIRFSSRQYKATAPSQIIESLNGNARDRYRLYGRNFHSAPPFPSTLI